MSGEEEIRDPFGVSGDAQSYIPREATEGALSDLSSYLRVGATQIALRGSVGLGKSLLLRVLAARLEGAMRVVEVPYPSLPAEEIAGWILNLMGLAPSTDAERTLVLQARMLREEGSGLAILIDDAASTPLPTLRRLSRIAREARPALHLVLALDDDARADEIIQAIGPDLEVVSFTTPMSEEETRAYLDGRLARAGAPEWLRRRFSDDAAAAIHQETGGLPVEVNRTARRWWSSFATGSAAGLPPGSNPDARPTGTALGSALLASSRPIDLGQTSGFESEPSFSEAPTELIELPREIRTPATPTPALPPRRPDPELPREPAIVDRDATEVVAASTDVIGSSPSADGAAFAVAEAATVEAATSGEIESEDATTVVPAPRSDRPRFEPEATPIEIADEDRPVRRTRPVVIGLAAAAAVAAAFFLGRSTAELPFADLRFAETRIAEWLASSDSADSADSADPATPLATTPELVADPTPEPEALARVEDEPAQLTASGIAASEGVGARGVGSTDSESKLEETPVEIVEESEPSTPAPSNPTVVAAATETPEVSSAPPAPVAATITEPPGATATGAGADAPTPFSAEAGASAEDGSAGEIPPISVSINATPWARIEIDGVEVGVTPLADVQLESGEHEFRAVFGDGRQVVRRERIDDLNRRVLFR